MSLYVSEGGGGDYKNVSTGTHPAVCSMLVDLGLQRSTFNGETKTKHKAWVAFEVPGERTDDGRPMSVGMMVTLSLHKKGNLRGMLESWRGRAFTEAELQKFDVSSVLGKPCMLNVLQEESGGKTYANIKGIMALPKGLPVPALEGKTVLYTGQPDVLATLPEWLQKKIAAQVKADAKAAPSQAAGSTADEDIPFAPRSWKEG